MAKIPGWLKFLFDALVLTGKKRGAISPDVDTAPGTHPTSMGPAGRKDVGGFVGGSPED